MRRLRELVPGVLIATAEQYTTNSTVVAGVEGECLVVDPAVSVADLAGLAADLADAGLRPAVGWATHPHWDHILWSRELGDVPRYAAPAAVAIGEQERAGQVDGVQQSAPGHDLELFGRLTALADDAIPWLGPEARLVVHDAHAPGHGAVFLPDTGVLLAGDMLSDIEIPLLDAEADDALGDYRAGLEKLAAVDGVRWLVPGHGHVGDPAEFGRRVDADRRYLDLVAGGQADAAGEDPRITADWLRQSHERHVRYLAEHS